MPFNKQAAFQLFYPEPLSGRDYTNLATCGVKRVQLFFKSALNLPRQLEELARMGVRVTLRLEEPPMLPIPQTYYNPATHAQIREGVFAVKRLVSVEAVVVGNEPEIEYNLAWGGRWGNNPEPRYPEPGGRAWAHGQAVRGVQAALRGVCQVISPGWSHKRVRPLDEPQPGRMTWRELTLPGYNVCDGNGAHVYAENWLSPEDENRYMWWLGEEVARCHRAVWLNETQVDTRGLPDLRQMQAVTKMADLIGSVRWGERVVSFTPFCANGQPNEPWSHMIMTDPAAYEHLGRWLAA
jgi:hypothetical protein